MIENPNVICNDCGFCKQNKELEERCKRLEKQLVIAVKRLEFLQKKTAAPYNLRAYKPIYEMVTKTLQQIKELDKNESANLR